MKLRGLVPRRIRAPLAAARRAVVAAVAGPLQPAVPHGSIVAICHCHQPDLVPELATCLLALPRGAALHVTSSATAVFAAWEPYRLRSRVPIRFHETENRGRDILPFVTVARTLDIAPDAAILKIHGKRSAYAAAGAWWRRDMLRGLLPGPFAARRAAKRFAADPRLALLGAPGAFIGHPVYWGRNREAVAALMRTVAGTDPRDEDLAFMAGTMFWIRGGFLAELLPHIDAARFEPEPIGEDGTYAHAVERVIGMAALARHWHVGETDTSATLTAEAVRHRTIGYI